MLNSKHNPIFLPKYNHPPPRPVVNPRKTHSRFAFLSQHSTLKNRRNIDFATVPSQDVLSKRVTDGQHETVPQELRNNNQYWLRFRCVTYNGTPPRSLLYEKCIRMRNSGEKVLKTGPECKFGAYEPSVLSLTEFGVFFFKDVMLLCDHFGSSNFIGFQILSVEFYCFGNLDMIIWKDCKVLWRLNILNRILLMIRINIIGNTYVWMLSNY